MEDLKHRQDKEPYFNCCLLDTMKKMAERIMPVFLRGLFNANLSAQNSSLKAFSHSRQCSLKLSPHAIQTKTYECLVAQTERKVICSTEIALMITPFPQTGLTDMSTNSLFFPIPAESTIAVEDSPSNPNNELPSFPRAKQKQE
ncbi:hypothetical protein AVEN_269864-1 [Araneus ventricosus]|uniref:Uncharacterized protein n=1 Tax=Araneus ventricosus TaxID=182803 RepID=A0A4Y2CF83_ARAVE|nr:hypothetical protein AVEN_269864-1 [Araneus ventricosus]